MTPREINVIRDVVTEAIRVVLYNCEVSQINAKDSDDDERQKRVTQIMNAAISTINSKLDEMPRS